MAFLPVLDKAKRLDKIAEKIKGLENGVLSDAIQIRRLSKLLPSLKEHTTELRKAQKKLITANLRRSGWSTGTYKDLERDKNNLARIVDDFKRELDYEFEEFFCSAEKSQRKKMQKEKKIAQLVEEAKGLLKYLINADKALPSQTATIMRYAPYSDLMKGS